MSLSDDIAAARADDDLRATLNRTLRQLEQAKAKKTELVEAVYQAAKDASMALVLAPVARPVKDTRKRDAETAIAMLSDWQLAKTTATYSTAVCEERIAQYAEKVISLTGIQRADHPVRELHVWLLGDLIEGELIFAGQAHQIDASLYRQVVVDGPRILCDFLRRMLASFDKVHVTAVIGNHGQIGGLARREMNPETNGDRMLYRIAQMVLASEKRLTWNIPDGPNERNWYAIDRIGAYSCLLFHGDQIRGGFAGFPFYGLAKKVWGWASGAIAEPFTDAAMGHWHQLALIPINKRKVFVNGSTESSNSYAAENLGAASNPAQWLLFVDPTKGRVTAQYAVDLS